MFENNVSKVNSVEELFDVDESDDAQDTDEQVTEETKIDETQTQTQTQTPTPDKQVKKKDPDNNPMRDLRNRANEATKRREKIEGAIQRLSEGDYDFKIKDFRNEEGKVDYDALLKAMDDADVKKRAETRGLSPEMQAEIEKYEKEKIEIERERARVQMDRQLNNFQLETKMDSAELNQFIYDSMKIGINPLAIASLDKTTKGTTALKMLHTAVYFDKLTKAAVDKAVAEAKATWETSQEGLPKPNPAAPNQTKTTKKDSKGLALEEFLKGL